MANLLDTLGASAGLSVEVRSAHGPWFAWTPSDDEPAAPAAPSSGGGGIGTKLRRVFVGWLKPQVIVRSNFGTLDKAPGGAPTATSWPALPIVAGIGLVVVLAFAFIGVGSLLRVRR